MHTEKVITFILILNNIFITVSLMNFFANKEDKRIKKKHVLVLLINLVFTE